MTMVLEARSFSDLIRNLTYLDSIMQFHADEVEAQKSARRSYEKLIDDLNFQKTSRRRSSKSWKPKRAEAETISCPRRAPSCRTPKATRPRVWKPLRQKAEGAGGCRCATGPVIDENADTIGREDVVDSNYPVQPTPIRTLRRRLPSPRPIPIRRQVPLLIPASAGRPASRPRTAVPPIRTPNPGTTANGSVCD